MLKRLSDIYSTDDRKVEVEKLSQAPLDALTFRVRYAAEVFVGHLRLGSFDVVLNPDHSLQEIRTPEHDEQL